LFLGSAPNEQGALACADALQAHLLAKRALGCLLEAEVAGGLLSTTGCKNVKALADKGRTAAT
jgi:hypothetical protein